MAQLGTRAPQFQPSPPATGRREAPSVSGWPSIPQPWRLIIDALQYWIARSRKSRATTAVLVAGEVLLLDVRLSNKKPRAMPRL
jgi:hypothetical protein